MTVSFFKVWDCFVDAQIFKLLQELAQGYNVMLVMEFSLADFTDQGAVCTGGVNAHFRQSHLIVADFRAAQIQNIIVVVLHSLRKLILQHDNWKQVTLNFNKCVD